MADRTAIEWTDATWNAIRSRRRDDGKVGWHCEHVSEGCRNCYSETFNHRRLPNGGTGLAYKPGHRDDVEIFLDETMLLAPLRWKKPSRIFVCSMTDLFGDWVPDAMIDRIFAVMALCPQHTFQVLTKRPARMRAYLTDERTPARIARICVDMWLADIVTPTNDWPVDSVGPVDLPDDLVMRFWPLPNVCLGTSCEDQPTADERIPELLATPAAVRFVSAEPLLGPIDFRSVAVPCDHPKTSFFVDALTGYHCALYTPMCSASSPDVLPPTSALDQIIVGGESGPGARPMHPAWAQSIRDQCAAAGVPFFFKQWGEWIPAVEGDDGMYVEDGGPVDRLGEVRSARTDFTSFKSTAMWRVGKHRAGRLLDGVEHDGMPVVRHE